MSLAVIALTGVFQILTWKLFGWTGDVERTRSLAQHPVDDLHEDVRHLLVAGRGSDGKRAGVSPDTSKTPSGTRVWKWTLPKEDPAARLGCKWRRRESNPRQHGSETDANGPKRTVTDEDPET